MPSSAELRDNLGHATRWGKCFDDNINA